MAVVTADSAFWDPLVYLFDFTLRFEEIILQLMPSALAIGACLIWYNHYRHEPVYVRSSPLLWAKIVRTSLPVVVKSASFNLITRPSI